MLLETHHHAPGGPSRSPESQPKITIVDRPCGSGKTSDMLKSFKPDRKYLVVTPLLSEVNRVIEEACVPFCQPQADHADRKLGSITDLLNEGLNVATSHELYADIAAAARQGLLDDYHIIIDEVLDVVKQVSGVCWKSWYQVYVEAGFATVDEEGQCNVTPKWIEECEKVQDTLRKSHFSLARAGSLHLVDGAFFLRALPPILLKSGQSITVYTYLAEGSMFLAYLRKLGLAFTHETCPDRDSDFRRQAASLITVRSIGSLDELSWSYTAQTAPRGRARREKRVAKALANLRCRDLRGVNLDSVMLTCPKAMWIPGESKAGRRRRATGYAVNSRMQKVRWVGNTTRGTNDHAHCTTAIYLWDQYMNPYLMRWLGLAGDRRSQDRYALTEFVQWLYRTRVRRGESVTVYVPSTRMRRIFAEWLETGNV